MEFIMENHNKISKYADKTLCCIKTYIFYFIILKKKIYFISDGKVECEACLKLVHPRGLSRHIRLVHGKLDLVSCNMCNKQFKSPEYLKDHLRRHHLIYQKQVAVIIYTRKIETFFSMAQISKQIYYLVNQKYICLQQCFGSGSVFSVLI